MRAIALLLVVAVAHLLPESAARHLGGTVRAWEVVCYGVETSILWWLVAHGAKATRAEWWVCIYGMFEAIQRPLWRAMLPMDQPPALQPGQFMGDAVTGLPVSALSPILLLWVIWQVMREIIHPVKVYSSNDREGET